MMFSPSIEVFKVLKIILITITNKNLVIKNVLNVTHHHIEPFPRVSRLPLFDKHETFDITTNKKAQIIFVGLILMIIHVNYFRLLIFFISITMKQLLQSF